MPLSAAPRPHNGCNSSPCSFVTVIMSCLDRERLVPNNVPNSDRPRAAYYTYTHDSEACRRRSQHHDTDAPAPDRGFMPDELAHHEAHAHHDAGATDESRGHESGQG